MKFKDYYLMTESKEKSYCLMVYPNEESIKKINRIHKLLQIRARENVTPSQYHTTIRYFKTTNDISPYIDYLKTFKFGKYAANATKLDFLGDSYSMFLESKELNRLFDKHNKWLLDNKYPKSDYPKYIPHLAFCYDQHKSWIPPVLDIKEYDIDITFENVKLTCDHQTIWKQQ